MFNFFNKSRQEDQVNTNALTDNQEKSRTEPLPDIPERVFIEKENLGQEQERVAPVKLEISIEQLFVFMDKNHEAKGYEDALMNPDISHLNQNVLALKNQFERTIRRVKTFYEDFIREIDFHIETRSRNGLVDIVDELRMKRNIADSHMQKVLAIEEEAKNDTGDSQGMIISYTRGFKNGLSAISHHSILKRF